MRHRSRNSFRTLIVLFGAAGLLVTSSALVVDIVVGRLMESVQTASAAAPQSTALVSLPASKN